MMKKMFLTLAMIVGITTAAMAQAEIKFDKLTYDFGDFSENDPVQTAKFTFTNVGDKPLIINQAIASCGCTVPKYSKEPIAPGAERRADSHLLWQGTFPRPFQEGHHRAHQRQG